MTKDIEQMSFFGEGKKSPTAATVAPKKSFFTPPTLENGLSKGLATDHAMLWLRTLAKQSSGNPSFYLSHQMAEIQFKRTAYDQVITVRKTIVKKIHKI